MFIYSLGPRKNTKDIFVDCVYTYIYIYTFPLSFSVRCQNWPTVLPMDLARRRSQLGPAKAKWSSKMCSWDIDPTSPWHLRSIGAAGCPKKGGWMFVESESWTKCSAAFLMFRRETGNVTEQNDSFGFLLKIPSELTENLGGPWEE